MSRGGWIPAEVESAAAKALGSPGRRLDARPIGGGCIHPAARVSAGGFPAFLKWAPRPGPATFGVEARGLEALRRRGGLRVPEVRACNEGGPETRGWLLLEYLSPAEPDSRTDGRLGTGLARLHRPLEDPRLVAGWDEPGWIGSLPQANEPVGAWPAFWREARILPQLRRALSLLPAPVGRRVEEVADRAEEALAGWEHDGLSLLHGDLWSGNVLVTTGGAPALVDPAAYRGHREVDIAMMELFGGFGPRAFQAYRGAAPLGEGYRERRRPTYQLYPLLVHVNLFGRGYAGRTEAAARDVLAALG